MATKPNTMNNATIMLFVEALLMPQSNGLDLWVGCMAQTASQPAKEGVFFIRKG